MDDFHVLQIVKKLRETSYISKVNKKTLELNWFKLTIKTQERRYRRFNY